MKQLLVALLLAGPAIAIADQLTDQADAEAIADGLATGEIKAACNTALAKITPDLAMGAWRSCYDRVKTRYFAAVRKQKSEPKSCETVAIRDSDAAADAPLKMSASPGWKGRLVRFEGTVDSFDEDSGIAFVRNGPYSVQVQIPRSAILIRYDTIKVGMHAYGYGKSNGIVTAYGALGQPISVQEVGAYCFEGPPLPVGKSGFARRLVVFDPPQ